MTRSGSGCSLSPRATAVIARLLAGCGGLLLERAGDDGADGGHGCMPAVCALAMLADLHHAAWLAAAA